MSKRESDILYFVSFCIEQYKKHHGMAGGDVMSLFDEYHVTEYLFENYDMLHTQGASWLMEEIENYIGEHKK